MQVAVHLFFIAGIEDDPAALRFHAYRIIIYHAFFNQAVDINPVWRNQGHKLIIHFKMNGNLEFVELIKV